MLARSVFGHRDHGGQTIPMTHPHSMAQQIAAASPASATQLQDFHQQLFKRSSEPLRQDTRRITGLIICEVAKDKATAAVQVFAVGTVVQVFLLAGSLPADSWEERATTKGGR